MDAVALSAVGKREEYFLIYQDGGPRVTCLVAASDCFSGPQRGGARSLGRGCGGQLPATVCPQLPARPREAPSRPARDPAASNVVNQMLGLLHSAGAADSS